MTHVILCAQDWMGKLQVASCVVVVDLGQLLNDETMKPAQLPPVVLATMEALQTSLDSIGVIVTREKMISAVAYRGIAVYDA